MAPPPRPTTISSSYGDQPLHPAPLRGRSLVVNSSIALVNAFMFFHYRRPEVLICWTMGQQCFNACMILILDAWETEHEQNLWLVNQAFAVFTDLHNNGVHKLAELAVQRISRGLVMLGQRKEQKKRQAAASRGAAGYHPQLQIDTTSMADFHNDTVMGNTGMFLLEDPGLQSYIPPAFAPLGWHMAGSMHPSNPSNSTTPSIPSPIVPVSQITAAPFPAVMSPTYMSAVASTVTQNSYIASMPPHLQHQQSHRSPGQQATFTPINTSVPASQTQSAFQRVSQQHQQQLSPIEQHVQQSFSQTRSPHYSHPSTHTHHSSHRAHNSSSGHSLQGTGAGPRGIHRLDRTPKSHHRRK